MGSGISAFTYLRAFCADQAELFFLIRRTGSGQALLENFKQSLLQTEICLS
jgi:hypothetical protein